MKKWLILLKISKYPLIEEVSKSGYYWTAFHFASHYGKVDILKYIIWAYQNHENSYDIFNLQTAEGKTPLFWWISSGDISLELKNRVVELWLHTGLIDFSLRKRTGENLVELAKKNGVKIEHLMIRED